MKILILGHGGHGKDTAASIINRVFGKSYTSSSWFALERVIWPVMQHEYDNMQQCFDDRSNRRYDWWKLIRQYNTPDPARLIKEVLEHNDMYVGLRDQEEFAAGRHLFDLILWVSAVRRLPIEPSMSIAFEPENMVLLDNNKDANHLRHQILKLRIK